MLTRWWLFGLSLQISDQMEKNLGDALASHSSSLTDLLVNARPLHQLPSRTEQFWTVCNL
jgi:hypothetical protein